MTSPLSTLTGPKEFPLFMEGYGGDFDEMSLKSREDLFTWLEELRVESKEMAERPSQGQAEGVRTEPESSGYSDCG